MKTKEFMKIANEKILNYTFLKEMLDDGYYPTHLVEKGQELLKHLCEKIEEEKPENLEELYKLTHEYTEKFNDLAYEFEAEDSEIETVAREAIALDFYFIARSYEFNEADIEELIAPRDW